MKQLVGTTVAVALVFVVVLGGLAFMQKRQMCESKGGCEAKTECHERKAKCGEEGAGQCQSMSCDKKKACGDKPGCEMKAGAGCGKGDMKGCNPHGGGEMGMCKMVGGCCCMKMIMMMHHGMPGMHGDSVMIKIEKDTVMTKLQ
jgi:hypothetical protein